jgi:hypothetical protein
MPSLVTILKEDFKGDRSKINAPKLNQLQKSGRITAAQNKKLRSVKMAYSKKLATEKKKSRPLKAYKYPEFPHDSKKYYEKMRIHFDEMSWTKQREAVEKAKFEKLPASSRKEIVRRAINAKITDKAKKIPAPKPKVDKDLLQVTMGIMANLGKEKFDERSAKEIKLEPFSIGQLKKIYRDFIKDKGRKAGPIPNRISKKNVIHWIITNNIPEKFYPKKATKGTKYTWTLEGWNILDDDAEEGDDPAAALNMYGGGVNWKFDNIYPSGFTAFTARATKEDMMKWKSDHEENWEKYARVYRETKTRRYQLWDDPFE